MKLYDLEQALGKDACSYWHKRASGELSYACNVSAAHGARFDRLIEPAAEALFQALQEHGALVKEDVLAFEAALSPMGDAAKAYHLHCAGHAHIDMNWMWGFQETASLAVDTFRTVLDLMRAYPQFTFSQSQASVYRILEEYAPEMLPEIRQRIREGRWEVTASTWVEPDKNMPSGESLARHLLYTKRYLSRLLELSPDTLQLDFEPDTFGHAQTIPEILAEGGVSYFYHCRGNDDEAFLYRYRAPSGAEVLTYRDPRWYNGTIEPKAPAETPVFCAKSGVPAMLLVYGVGDHGGGPTRRDIERLLDMQTWPIYPEIRFSTFRAFFAEAETFREQLPVVTHELNYVFTGCYTSQSRIKMANRFAERKLYEAEALSAAACLTAGIPNATGRFADAWREILFNHFHDILPGSGVVDTREYAMGGFQRAMACADIDANRALRALSQAVDTSGIPFSDDDGESISEGAGVGYAAGYNEQYAFPRVERGRGKTRVFTLWNPAQYGYDRPVELTVWDWPGDANRLTVADAEGAPLPFQILESSGIGRDGTRGDYWGHTFLRVLVKTEVPAFGHTVCVLREASREAPLGARLQPDPRTDPYEDKNITLENERLRAVFQRGTLRLISLFDKAADAELLDPARPAASFRLVMENDQHGMTAWRVGDAMHAVDLNAESDVHAEDPQIGALRQSVTYSLRCDTCSLRVQASLDAGADTLEFRTEVEWLALGKPGKGVPQLQFAVPFGFPAAAYERDIPCGLIQRPALGHDVPAQTLLAAKAEKGGLVLTTDTKYGYRGDENTLSVTLLRGSYEPDPYPELGRHFIRIGIGAVRETTPAALYALSSRFNCPPSYTPTGSHGGILPPAGGSFLDVPDSLRVSGIKLAEDDLDTLILRLYDVSGRDGKAELTVPGAGSAVLCDLLERETGEPLSVRGGVIEAPVRAFGLLTLRIRR